MASGPSLETPRSRAVLVIQGALADRKKLSRRNAAPSCRSSDGRTSPSAVTFFAFHTVEEIPDPHWSSWTPLGSRCWLCPARKKPSNSGLTPIAAVMMGAISGAGGYTIRDILLAEVPAVLRVDFLATSAIIGAIVLVVARSLKAPANIAALLGARPASA